MPNPQFFSSHIPPRQPPYPCCCGAQMTPTFDATRDEGQVRQQIQRWECPTCGCRFSMHQTWTAPTIVQTEMEV